MESRKDKPKGQSVDIYRLVIKQLSHFREDGHRTLRKMSKVSVVGKNDSSYLNMAWMQLLPLV